MGTPMRLVALLALCALPTAGTAHGLFANVKVIDGTVRVEVFFEDNEPAKQAKVKVLNAANDVILEGTTDDAGVWTCPAPQTGRYTLNVKHTGHSAKGSFQIVPPDAPPPPQTEPTREDLTGPQRLLWVSGGLAVVAVVFGGWYLMVRKRASGERAPSGSGEPAT